jgi:hypothetical protein
VSTAPKLELILHSQYLWFSRLDMDISGTKTKDGWQYETGRVYDLGGQVLASQSSPTIMSMVLELDLKVEMEDMSQHHLASINLDTARYENFKMATDYVSIMAVTAELQVRVFHTGLDDVAI